jgi:hypothetical protein
METNETTREVGDDVLDQVYGGTAKPCECSASCESGAARPGMVCC